jgi:hypothetical protein
LALGCALAPPPPHPHPNWQALDASSSSSSSSSESMNSSGHWDESCSVYSSSHAVVSRTLGSVPASRAGPVGSAAPCRSFVPSFRVSARSAVLPALIRLHAYLRRTMSPRGSLRGRPDVTWHVDRRTATRSKCTGLGAFTHQTTGTSRPCTPFLSRPPPPR